uniref:Putative secreted protein n=1 Tax=Ixodes ricinus TaxID=34613 RepID=A0A6B0U362_IXORI
MERTRLSAVPFAALLLRGLLGRDWKAGAAGPSHGVELDASVFSPTVSQNRTRARCVHSPGPTGRHRAPHDDHPPDQEGLAAEEQRRGRR